MSYTTIDDVKKWLPKSIRESSSVTDDIVTEKIELAEDEINFRLRRDEDFSTVPAGVALVCAKLAALLVIDYFVQSMPDVLGQGDKEYNFRQSLGAAVKRGLEMLEENHVLYPEHDLPSEEENMYQAYIPEDSEEGNIGSG